MSVLRPLSLILATLTTGLTAGFFYAYACSVTLGLARLDDAQYVAAMQAINATVRNPVFAFGFFGALLSLILAVALHAGEWRATRTRLLGLALVVYAVGGFGPTFAFSVPLNDDLARVSLDAGPEALAQARLDYEDTWNRWNTTRTIASSAAFLLLIAATLAPAVRPFRVRATDRAVNQMLLSDPS